MTAVIDASVFVAALVDTEYDGVWADLAISEITLACPEIALAEAVNILRRMEVSGRISNVNAVNAHAALFRYKIELYSYTPFAERIWELRSNLTSYDAWYVAIAESLDAPLLTLDRRLSRASGPRCEFITPPNF